MHLALGMSSSVRNTAVGAATKQTLAWLWFSRTTYIISVGRRYTTVGKKNELFAIMKCANA